jgi:hypothetical protein
MICKGDEGLKKSLSNRKTFPTATFIGDIRIVELESHAKAFRHEIYLRTIEKTKAFLGHHNFDAIIFKNNVIFLDVFGQLHRVGPTRTARFPDAKTQADAAVFIEESPNPLRGGFA